MAGISIAIPRGKSGAKLDHYTVGTSTPGAGDFELRWNTTDTNGAVITRQEVKLAAEAIIRQLESGAQLTTSPVL